MSLKKTLAKALTGVALATTLISPLYPAKENKADALELISIGYSFLDNSSSETQQQSNNSNLYKQKQQKHYNWIKPDKYSKWQCSYELTYNRDTPDGFKLYVDENGDGKPDYTYKYYLNSINAFYGGATYEFRLDTSMIPVGGGWKSNGYKAMNVCGPDAVKSLFYEREDLVKSPSEYKIDEVDYDLYYPEVTFVR